MKILYICTHNRCRSILSEALTNFYAAGKIQAFSAGSQPVGEVHPLSLKFLQEKNIPISSLKSQSWLDFENKDIDLVITVCDSAANETCPLWFNDTLTHHWALPDPSKLNGDEHVLRTAFFDVMTTIEKRIQILLQLDWDTLSLDDKKYALQQLKDD